MESFIQKLLEVFKRFRKMVKLSDLKTGDYVLATIEGLEVVGQIVLDHNPDSKRLFILQNRKLGSTPYPESYEKTEERALVTSLINNYEGSWVCSFKNGGYTQSVQIHKTITKEETEKIIADINSKAKAQIVTRGDRLYITKPMTEISLFGYKNHPDCCGNASLYNFSDSTQMSYCPYRDLNDDDFKVIKGYIMSERRSMNVYLAHYQKPAIELVEKLGFTKIHEFVNVKSGNKVSVFHLDMEDTGDYDEDDE